ncbi:hypothetical protein K0M31_008653, partial [Melipona bicolor]
SLSPKFQSIPYCIQLQQTKIPLLQSDTSHHYFKNVVLKKNLDFLELQFRLSSRELDYKIEQSRPLDLSRVFRNKEATNSFDRRNVLNEKKA